MKKADKPLSFTAEVCEVKSKKLRSLDVSYRVLFETENAEVLGLGALKADQLVKVTVEPAQ